MVTKMIEKEENEYPVWIKNDVKISKNFSNAEEMRGHLRHIALPHSMHSYSELRDEILNSNYGKKSGSNENDKNGRSTSSTSPSHSSHSASHLSSAAPTSSISLTSSSSVNYPSISTSTNPASATTTGGPVPDTFIRSSTSNSTSGPSTFTNLSVFNFDCLNSLSSITSSDDQNLKSVRLFFDKIKTGTERGKRKKLFDSIAIPGSSLFVFFVIYLFILFVYLFYFIYLFIYY